MQHGDRLEVTFSRSYPADETAFRQVYRWQGLVERAGEIVGRFEQDMRGPGASPMPRDGD